MANNDTKAKRNNSMPASRNNPRTCPLSDPSIGIVSENDHKVGLCLCRFCTCSKHVCPYLEHSDLYLKSAFKSTYSNEFKKSGFDKPIRVEPKLYQPNKQKMDLTTTNNAEYKPFSVPPQEQKGVRYSKPKPFTVSGESSYSNQFPNWGPYYVNYEKRWHPPVRSTELRFQGDSSYRNSFLSLSQEQIKHTKTNFSTFSALGSKFSLGPKVGMDAKTTYAEKMQNYNGTNLNYRVKVKAPKVNNPSTPKDHFKTSTGNFFKTFTPQTKDPRMFRHQLMSRG